MQYILPVLASMLFRGNNTVERIVDNSQVNALQAQLNAQQADREKDRRAMAELNKNLAESNRLNEEQRKKAEDEKRALQAKLDTQDARIREQAEAIERVASVNRQLKEDFDALKAEAERLDQITRKDENEYKRVKELLD